MVGHTCTCTRSKALITIAQSTILFVNVLQFEVPEKIPIHPTHPMEARLLEIPRGRGILQVKILEVKYEAKLEKFPMGVQNKKPSVG